MKIDLLACSIITKSWVPVVFGGTNSTEIPDGIKDLEGYNLILLFGDNTSTKYDSLSNPAIGSEPDDEIYTISSPVLKGTGLGNEIIVNLSVNVLYPWKLPPDIVGLINSAWMYLCKCS